MCSFRSQKYDQLSVEGRVTSRHIVGKAGGYFGGPLRHISTYSHRCSTELLTGGERDVLVMDHETQHSGPSHRFGNSGHGSSLCNLIGRHRSGAPILRLAAGSWLPSHSDQVSSRRFTRARVGRQLLRQVPTQALQTTTDQGRRMALVHSMLCCILFQQWLT